MKFDWTDELVSEFVEICKNGKEPFDILLEQFKGSKNIIPEGIKITHFIAEDDLVIPVFTNNHLVRLLHDENCKIFICEKDGVIFEIGDTVFNEKQYKKYGGKWSSHAVKINSFDFRINKIGEKITSTQVLINDFFDIKFFIKK